MSYADGMAAHFARIRVHYAKHREAILANGSEWFDDAYSWEHEAGIRLTPIERALWHDIRAEGLVLYPQYPVGRYFVDFGNPACKVAIECDGARWHQDAGSDAIRQRQIESLEWSVYRITGRDCLTDTEEVEDDTGCLTLTVGAARRFIRDVADKHPCLRRW